MTKKISKSEALKILTDLIKEFENIISNAKYENMYDENYEEFYNYAEKVINELFSEKDKNEFRDGLAFAVSFSDDKDEELKDYKTHLKSIQGKLNAFKRKIENFWNEDKTKSKIKLPIEFFNKLSLFIDSIDPLFFKDILNYTESLIHFNYKNLSKEELAAITDYIKKIDDFFEDYKREKVNEYTGPNKKIEANYPIIKRMKEIIDELNDMSDEELKNEMTISKPGVIGNGIFIGHGRSKLWATLKIHLKDELKLDVFSFESEPHEGESIVTILEEFLNKAAFAILVLTAEDETKDKKLRARQNVIHEAGLFQGRLGFKKAILLVQEGVEEYSNIAGLQCIKFHGDDIESTFYNLSRVLKREGLISQSAN
jgi:predicted nucleotide-binding protein